VADAKKTSRSLISIAGILAVATLVSKLFGLLRQTAIAAAYGVGPAVDAYSYAYVLPGFLFILLGGINGPFHSAIISVLAKRPKEEAAPLVETVTTLVSGVLLIVTGLLILLADPLTQLIAPGLFRTAAQAQADGLTVAQFEVLQQTQRFTVEQFRIMAPMAIFSGLIGIGFGTLTAADQYWLPSISPLFSSLTVIIGLLIFRDQKGLVLAWGTLAGAVLQWLVQVPAQWRSGMGTLRLRFDWNRPGVDEIWNIMGPATLSSGMSLISVSISLFFASQLGSGVAAGLGYAQLLYLTPLGILSNVVLVPLMSLFSQLAAPEKWPEFKLRLRQGLITSALATLPLAAVICALSLPAVRLVYERKAFDLNASQLVAELLFAYSLGMFFYLGRDVLVRAFYGLGDGATPFKVSLWGLGFNLVFCFLFTKTFGPVGLALAPMGINILSMVILLWYLHQRLNGLPWRDISVPMIGLTVSGIAAAVAAWGALLASQFALGNQIILGIKEFSLIVQLAISGAVGMGVFILIALQLQIPEVDALKTRILQQLQRSSR
jgi:putative peptidoglycan lipid II flippase